MQSDIQYIQMRDIHTRTLSIITLIASLIVLSLGICRNNSESRYDLRLPSELINYSSVCFEYSKRTCCSVANFEAQARRITKIMGGSFELSHECRRIITNMICSSCDADVGQGNKEGVCDSYCKRIYQTCKNDYFTADSNNQLRVCRQEDLVCSKMEAIVAQKGKEYICQLFQQKVSRKNCWNGQISARIKGKGPNKVTIPIKSKPKKKKVVPLQPWISNTLFITIVVGCIVAGIILYKYYSHQRRQWKRQIRNL